MSLATEELSTAEWWGKKRLRYNIGLAIAGISAFVIYTGIAYSLDNSSNIENILSTIPFDCLLYLTLMGIANFCFFLGPLAEVLYKPTDVEYYRHLTYNLGFWFSIALPLSIPGFRILFLSAEIAYG